jgi:hypothetical protein
VAAAFDDAGMATIGCYKVHAEGEPGEAVYLQRGMDGLLTERESCEPPPS